jgi:hypothetical protein
MSFKADQNKNQAAAEQQKVPKYGEMKIEEARGKPSSYSDRGRRSRAG